MTSRHCASPDILLGLILADARPLDTTVLECQVPVVLLLVAGTNQICGGFVIFDARLMSKRCPSFSPSVRQGRDAPSGLALPRKDGFATFGQGGVDRITIAQGTVEVARKLNSRRGQK